VGDWVLALGQPFGLESTVTAGIISAKHRGIGITDRENFLQTDAAINPGNSGGPLVNLDGEVIGINTAISSRSGGNNGIGFAVPVNLAKWVTNQLVRDGVVHRAYLGVSIQPMTQELASQFGVQPREGVVVTQAFPNTPAAKMGLQQGDVIVSLRGKKVRSAQELQLLVEQSELGTAQTMQIVRDGKTMTLGFSPETQPETFGASASPPNKREEEPAPDALGLSLDTLTAEVARQLGLESAVGVVITAVQSGSAAEQAGLKPGLVIRQMDRRQVADAAAAEKILAEVEPGKSVLLLVQSDARSQFIVLKK
jgi:serine protease Do